jgi:hypothetical protein
MGAMLEDGTAYVWGENGYGQLSNGEATRRVSPTVAGGAGSKWKSVSSGSELGGAGHVVGLGR